MKAVHFHWANYSQRVMPVWCSDTQLNEGKLCFYAGATSMLAMVLERCTKLPPEQASAAIQELRDEISVFSEQFSKTGVIP